MNGHRRCWRRPFDDLETVKFNKVMEPAAICIYATIWPNSRIVSIPHNQHILDTEYHIDKEIITCSGQTLTLQEKYRRQIGYWDFTQEYRNGDGRDGEWFNLTAQFYFYGWAHADLTKPLFYVWFILDVAKYKLCVDRAGGLGKIGIWKKNKKHGKAEFYAINAAWLQEQGCMVFQNAVFKWNTAPQLLPGNKRQVEQHINPIVELNDSVQTELWEF